MEFVTNKRFLVGLVAGAVAWHFLGGYVMGLLPSKNGG